MIATQGVSVVNTSNERGRRVSTVGCIAVLLLTTFSPGAARKAPGDLSRSAHWSELRGDASPQTATQEDGFLRVQAPMSNRCVTPYGMCMLPGYIPVGAPCWCATAYGPVSGRAD
jgi:hypothetical protein